jgi:hypothetical protein
MTEEVEPLVLPYGSDQATFATATNETDGLYVWLHHTVFQKDEAVSLINWLCKTVNWWPVDDSDGAADLIGRQSRELQKQNGELKELTLMVLTANGQLAEAKRDAERLRAVLIAVNLELPHFGYEEQGYRAVNKIRDTIDAALSR